MLGKEEIDHLAALSRIALTEAEKSGFSSQLEAILAYVGEVGKVVTEDRPVAPGIVRNVTRRDEDANETGSSTDAILANAPRVEDGYVRVKHII